MASDEERLKLPDIVFRECIEFAKWTDRNVSKIIQDIKRATKNCQDQKALELERKQMRKQIVEIQNKKTALNSLKSERWVTNETKTGKPTLHPLTTPVKSISKSGKTEQTQTASKPKDNQTEAEEKTFVNICSATKTTTPNLSEHVEDNKSQAGSSPSPRTAIHFLRDRSQCKKKLELDVEEETQEQSEEEQDKDKQDEGSSLHTGENPFPQIRSFFMLKGETTKNSDTKIYSFNFCKKSLKVHKITVSKLKRHITVVHPDKRDEFIRELRKKRTQKISETSADRLSETKRSETNSIQSDANMKIVDFFVDNLIDLKVVESETFVAMLKTWNQHLQPITSDTLEEMIDNRQMEIERSLCR